jgi:nicotinamidase-related amidase
MRLKMDQCVAVILDVQERLFHYVQDHERLAVNLVTLIRGLKQLGVPVLRTQQYTRGLGPTIRPVDEGLSDVPVLEKMTFSCCGEPAFSSALSATGKKIVVLAGIEAHVCILQTAVDLLDAGYVPVVIEDCISSRKENDKAVAVRRLCEEGAVISTYESILFELCGKAGTETFRAILKLVK